MDTSRERRSSSSGVVAAGSVWETRMKNDQVSGGFKVFNPNNNNNSDENDGPTTTRPKRVQVGPKRKTWNSVASDQRSPVRELGRGRGEIGLKRSPITHKPKSVSRSEPTKEIQRRKPGSAAKPAEKPVVDEVGPCEDEDIEEAIAASPGENVGEEVKPDDDDEDEEIEVEIKEIEAQEAKPEEEVNAVENVGEAAKSDGGDDDDEEIEVEIKEIKAQEAKPEEEVVNAVEEVNAAEKVEVKRVSFERKLEAQPHNNNNKKKNNSKIFHQKQSETISLNVKTQPPLIKRATIHSNSDAYHSFPESHTRLQSFVDLIMWKEISRSVFIFGTGTFTILSSSYTKDLNISFISVISYLGLVYLAAIFLFRSIVCRGVIDMDFTSYVLGEEEAIWLLKLVLPYLNEFLLKLKALFSGDPATTMKLAALLFILARCGSSVTIWTMAKLGFFGVFTVPKVCSLYSTHVTAYAKFWVRRFRDAWDSCSHKKGVTIGVFLLVWNLSSIVARIWAVFMLYVAFRYYQQNIVGDDWVEDGPEVEETWHEPIGVQKHGPGPTTVDQTKQKKRS